MATIDHSPAKVYGEVEAQRARVIWKDGTLFVFESSDEVTVFDAPSRPTRVSRPHGGTWYASDGVDVYWRKGGCKCSCSLCRLSRDGLLESATATM